MLRDGQGAQKRSPEHAHSSGPAPGMVQDAPSLGMSSVPWESSSGTEHHPSVLLRGGGARKGCRSSGGEDGSRSSAWNAGATAEGVMGAQNYRVSAPPSPELPLHKPFPVLPVGSIEGHTRRSSRECWPSRGIDVLGKEGSAPEDHPSTCQG